MEEKPKYLKHIQYFRAFAIINIVFIHTWEFPSDCRHNASFYLLNTIRELVFHDSTIYFLFISGFLFQYLSPKFELLKYYKSKLHYVIFPYIFMTLLVLVDHKACFIADNNYTFISFFRDFSESLITGNVQPQFWYIPFIAIVFIISPLFLKIPKNAFSKIALLGCLLPLLGTRTDSSLSFLQYAYFLPVYLLGMYISMNYSKAILFIKEKSWLFISLVGISSILLLLLPSDIYDFGWMNLAESLFYIQKISLSLLLLVLLMKIENKEISLLDNIATYSFAIYFTHVLVGNRFLKTWFYNQVLTLSPGVIIFLSIIFVLSLILINLIFCMLIKRFLGKWSRYFIGA